MSIWRWAERFSDLDPAFYLTRGEGNTPLVRSTRLGHAAGLDNLWFKLETTNPTGSYKDRFAAAAVSAMKARGQTHIIATSSGNTGAALAAYAAMAGMSCEIAAVEKAPDDKLNQMRLYGARVYKVRGFGVDPVLTTQVFEQVAKRGRAKKCALQISAYKYSPLGMAGVETIAHELADELPELRHVFCPAGGGGLVAAMAAGFSRAAEGKRLNGPSVHCVQPAGNDTIATPLRAGSETGRAVPRSATAISGLQVPGLIDADAAIKLCRRSGGTGHVVSDEKIWTVQRQLAREEGLYVEPAAATAVAGAFEAVKQGDISPNDVVVCVLTGIGFKDRPSTQKMVGNDSCEMMAAEEFLAK